MYSATSIKYYSAFISVSTSKLFILRHFNTNNSIASVLCNVTTIVFCKGNSNSVTTMVTTLLFTNQV